MHLFSRRHGFRSSLVAFAAGGVLLAPMLAAPASAVVVPSPGLPPAGVADPEGVSLRLQAAATGLVEPVFVATAPEGRSRLYVVERAGRIKLFSGGVIDDRPYLSIRGRVKAASGEQGLLGLAFSPNFLTDRHLWVSYTDADGALQVSRFTAKSPTSRHVYGSTEVKVLRVPHPGNTNHNGGMLVFGRDDRLYISTGDGGGSGDPSANGQDRHTLAGKILRINPFSFCGDKHYCIPKSNPYAKPGGAWAAIWLYGLRNPWRFTADRDSGDLWIGDVGQASFEEVTRVPYGESGWNLGWSCREARSVYNESRCSAAKTYHDPTIAYGRSEGASVIGGYVYRGAADAALLAGLYVYGDFISGHIWVQGHGTSVLVGEAGAYRLTAFGQDGSGELWATTLDGGLYQVVASAA